MEAARYTSFLQQKILHQSIMEEYHYEGHAVTCRISEYICADSCGLWSVTACGYFCDFIYVDN